MDSTSLVAVRLCNERTLRIGEPCTGEHVTLPQSFHKYILIIYINTQLRTCSLPFPSLSYVDAGSFETTIFSIYLQVAVATSIFVNKAYSGRLAPESSVAMLKEK